MKISWRFLILRKKPCSKTKILNVYVWGWDDFQNWLLDSSSLFLIRPLIRIEDYRANGMRNAPAAKLYKQLEKIDSLQFKFVLSLLNKSKRRETPQRILGTQMRPRSCAIIYLGKKTNYWVDYRSLGQIKRASCLNVPAGEMTKWDFCSRMRKFWRILILSSGQVLLIAEKPQWRRVLN